MRWLHVVLVLAIIGLAHGIQDVNDETKQQNEVKTKEKVDKVSDLFPYEFPEEFLIPRLTWDEGYLHNKPTFATIYDPIRSDLHIYIFPPHHCNVVWLCFMRAFNTTSTFMHLVDWQKACYDNSLRFHTLEQIVYVTSSKMVAGEKEPRRTQNQYPYYSPRVDLLFGYRSDKQEMYTFLPFKEFDLEDFGKVERLEGISFDLWNSRILLLTSNPYCHVTVQQPLYGIADGYSLAFMPLDSEEYLKQGVEANVGKGPYFFSGTKVGSTLRVKTWANNPSLAFDPPDKRNKLKQAFFDCCPPTWEFEDFVFSTDWSANPFISYQKYTLHKSSKSICSAELESGQTVPYQSFLIEVGKRCEWIRICFDDKGKFCENDGNTLTLIFVHDVYIPTDSDNARPIGVEFKELDPIRINFLIGHQAIEMAYAFSSVTAPGITDLMQLDKYDGKDPSKLEINVVKAPYCEARLLNDMAAVNVQRGIEAGSQCLSISSCTCLE